MKARSRIAGAFAAGAMLIGLGATELLSASEASARPPGGCTVHLYSTYAFADCSGPSVNGTLTAECVHAGVDYYVYTSGLGSIEADCHPGDLLVTAHYSLL